MVDLRPIVVHCHVRTRTDQSLIWLETIAGTAKQSLISGQLLMVDGRPWPCCLPAGAGQVHHQ
jgi:hypothetical protein